MAISFVDCRAEHLPDLQAFFARMYQPNYSLRVSEALFRWQFGGTLVRKENNPYHIKLALLNDKIAGCLGYIPVEISFADRVVRGAWTANWMVDTNWHRLGLGILLMREVTRQFEITLAVGLSRDARNLLPRMGWNDFGELNRYVAVLDTARAGTLTETGRLEWPITNLTKKWDPPRGFTVELVTNFSDDATLLWDQTCANSAAGTRRSAEFLNWRYAKHPTFEYRLFEARKDGRLSGFAVYRVEQVSNMPVRVGRIVELVSETAGEGSLLRTVIDDARSHDVVALDFFCSSRRLSRVMDRYGFLLGTHEAAARIPTLFQPIDRRRAGIPFMAHPANSSELAGIQDWYVTKGDGDQDRPN